MNRQSLSSATLVLVLSILLISCRNKKDKIIDSIIRYGVFEGMYIGPSDSISPQWINFEHLTRNFSEQELIKLCEHKNPIVRCYAFKALTELCSQEVYSVLLNHLSDTSKFDRAYGCIWDYDRVTDNFLEQVGFDRQSPTKYSLSEEQYDYIDSVLLFGDEIKQRSWLGTIEYPSRRHALERAKPLPQLYNRTKELAEAGIYEALPLLAQYKNPADTSIIIDLLKTKEPGNFGRTSMIYVMESIRHFPHPSFYSILKDLLIKEVGTNAIYDDSQSYPFYIALVQYKTQETRKLLDTALKMSILERPMRSRIINYALKHYPSSVFEGLTYLMPEKN